MQDGKAEWFVKKKKKKLGDMVFGLVIGAVLLAGVGLLLYPTVANWYNESHASRAIAAYEDAIAQVSTEDYDRMMTDAQAYNMALYQTIDRWKPDEEGQAVYDSLLDVTGTGIMAYVEIPKIHVKLPIYHGTEETTLAVAVGHLEGSSLPVGGKGSHVVMSGHSALPSARLFTDLAQVEIGDVFTVSTLGQVMTYQVDAINVVLPYEFELFALDPEQDYVTLVTCTPYGVNSHRLLVRGTRIFPEAEVPVETVSQEPTESPEADASVVSTKVSIISAAVFCVLVLGGGLFVFCSHKKRNGRMQQ